MFPRIRVRNITNSTTYVIFGRHWKAIQKISYTYVLCNGLIRLNAKFFYDQFIKFIELLYAYYVELVGRSRWFVPLCD